MSKKSFSVESLLFNFLSISLFVFLFGAISSIAHAQSAGLSNDPASLVTSAGESDSKRPFVYSGQLIIETARNADEGQAESFSGLYLLSGSVTHKLSALTGTVRVGYSREYTYQRDDRTDGSFENPTAAIAKSFINGRDFKLSWIDSISLSLSGAIGANRESARRHFLWSNGLSVSGTKTYGRFQIKQAFAYTHGFYDFEIRDNGVVNSPDSVRSTTSIYAELTPKISLGGEFTVGIAQSFQGVSRSSQSTQISADYMIAEKVAMSIGVSSERSTLEPDGQSNRLRFYAPESAQYFVDLVILL